MEEAASAAQLCQPGRAAGARLGTKPPALELAAVKEEEGNTIGRKCFHRKLLPSKCWGNNKSILQHIKEKKERLELGATLSVFFFKTFLL